MAISRANIDKACAPIGQLDLHAMGIGQCEMVGEMRTDLNRCASDAHVNPLIHD
jgi:hypothetical protein